MELTTCNNNNNYHNVDEDSTTYDDEEDNIRLSNDYPWISKILLQNLIRNYLKNNTIELEWYSIKPALAKGENYCSQLIRINIDYYKMENHHQQTQPPVANITIKHNITIIIKADIKGSEEMSSELDMFLKEITIYIDIMPKMYKLLNDINDKTKFGPLCCGTGVKPYFIAFKDLAVDGYKNVNRRHGLTYQHYEHILIKLAKWHATGAVLGTNNIDIMKNHMKPHITETSGFLAILDNALLACADAIRNWTGFKEISEKMIKSRKTFVSKCCAAFTRNDNDFNTIIHGDLWANNTMFKYDVNNKDKIEDVLFVDFAVGFWGSPGIDLSYTLFTSSDVSVQEKEWDTLLLCYYKQLCLTLTELNYPIKRIPNFTDIHIEILKCGIYPAILSLILCAVRNIENIEHATLSLFICPSDIQHARRVELISTPECRKTLEYLIGYYHRKGYFD